MLIAESSNVEVKDGFLSFTLQNTKTICMYSYETSLTSASQMSTPVFKNTLPWIVIISPRCFLPLALLLHWHTMLFTSHTVTSRKESTRKRFTWRRGLFYCILIGSTIPLWMSICRVLCIWRDVHCWNKHLTRHGFISRLTTLNDIKKT